MNTGYKQATIAYKVSKPGGEPLDVDGNLTRISGKKQAIALLEGHVNPDASKYEVEFYYDKRGSVTGNPTITYNVRACPAGYIRVTPTRIVLDPDAPAATVNLESSGSWRLISGQPIAMVDYTKGYEGVYQLTISRTTTTGQSDFIFFNEATRQTAAVYVVNVVSRPWVLENGSWNDLGFWYDNGAWNY